MSWHKCAESCEEGLPGPDIGVTVGGTTLIITSRGRVKDTEQPVKKMPTRKIAGESMREAEKRVELLLERLSYHGFSRW